MHAYVTRITKYHLIAILRIRRSTNITDDIFIILNTEAFFGLHNSLYFIPGTYLEKLPKVPTLRIALKLILLIYITLKMIFKYLWFFLTNNSFHSRMWATPLFLWKLYITRLLFVSLHQFERYFALTHRLLLILNLFDIFSILLT